VITQVSCKLTNSLLCFFERQGFPLAPIYELFDGPEEFLWEPHFWIEPAQAEKIFERAARLVGDPKIATTVGSQIADLQSWGALDSVFKLMPSVKDYYTNLPRFFSYFVAPTEDFKDLEQGDTFARFKFPVDRSRFPHVFDFIRATLEVLPRYTGNAACNSEWGETDNVMLVNWDTAQPSLFAEEPGQVLSPKLVQSLTMSLENSGRALEAKNREIVELKARLDSLNKDVQSRLKETLYAEKMSGLAQLAAGVAHEINNPLSFVISNLGRFEEYFGRLRGYVKDLEDRAISGKVLNANVLRALKEESDVDFILSETPSMLKESSGGLLRVKEIVKDLTSLAHPRDGRAERKIPTDLNGILESSLKVFSDDMADRITVQKKLHLRSRVEVFPVRISQVFMNLISNAVQAIPATGVIEVKTEERDHQAVIEITDTGVGMDALIKSRIFTPFFTTKEVGKGTGLGLSIAQSIVEMHKGRIEVESEKGQGSRFVVTLPIQEKTASLDS
jgi:signal transduction histidine kinase